MDSGELFLVLAAAAVFPTNHVAFIFIRLDISTKIVSKSTDNYITNGNNFNHSGESVGQPEIVNDMDSGEIFFLVLTAVGISNYLCYIYIYTTQPKLWISQPTST